MLKPLDHFRWARMRSMTREYQNLIAEFWPTVMQAWQEHSDKHPVIECDLASRTVAAYPADDYIDSLSERTRKATHQEFHRVVDQGGIMVFIRDPENRVLQSYTFTANNMTGKGKANKRLQRTGARSRASR
jgi:hypothetical protein